MRDIGATALRFALPISGFHFLVLTAICTSFSIPSAVSRRSFACIPTTFRLPWMPDFVVSIKKSQVSERHLNRSALV